MYTIAENLTGKETQPDMPNMMVTPRDIDRLVERSSSLISAGLNLALHPQLSYEEVENIMF